MNLMNAVGSIRMPPDNPLPEADIEADRNLDRSPDRRAEQLRQLTSPTFEMHTRRLLLFALTTGLS